MTFTSSDIKWYDILNISDIDTPALIVYKERVRANIRLAKSMVKEVEMLRPHIKTHKMKEVCQLLLNESISKFKCATIAEAELLGAAGAKDVLLAYQPVGPKANRFLNLINVYPSVRYSCLVDHPDAIKHLNGLAGKQAIVIEVFIDLNVGMNRTGIIPLKAFSLAEFIQSLDNIRLVGLHAYDGHIKDANVKERKEKADEAFQQVLVVQQKINADLKQPVKIIISGTPTFPIHALRQNVECSPGTFVFTDWGYKQSLPDIPFDFAALVITRVISIIDEHTICTDLGHKSVAAETPLPRVHFLNAPDAIPVAQSEEHLVVKVEDASFFSIGDVLFGVPVHICPTVALYEKASIVENNLVISEWRVVARDRFINI